jgi:RNA polymerase sigma-70 factor (ECF subfamily)
MTTEAEARQAGHGAVDPRRPAPAKDQSQRGYDGLLLAVGRRRDPTAFTKLFSHFGPQIGAYLRRLGAQPAQAEDLVQDVMLTVWQRAAQFDGGRAPARAWVFAIARNRFIDLQRRHGREKLMLDPTMVPHVTEGATEDSLYLTELQHRLREAMAVLPGDQTDLLRQSYYRHKSQSTLAEELELPLGTVKSRQRLGLAKLRDILGELRP